MRRRWEEPHDVVNAEGGCRTGTGEPRADLAWCDERRLAHIRSGARGRRSRILIAEEDLEDLLKSLRVTVAESGDGADGPPPLKHIRLS